MCGRRSYRFLFGVLTPLAVVQTGCRESQDRGPLTELLTTLAEAGKEDFQDEIKTYPRDEWAVRRGALTTRRDLKVIDDFMQKNPPLSQRGKTAVESLRENCRKRAGLFEGVTKESRFKLTEGEKEELRKLMEDDLQRVKDIGRIIDGE